LITIGLLGSAVGKVELCALEIVDGNKEYSLLLDKLEGIVFGDTDEG
jgi:hypothetical protein